MQRTLTSLVSLLVAILFAACVFTLPLALATNANASSMNASMSIRADLAGADPVKLRVALLPLQAERFDNFDNEGETTEDKQFGLSHVFAAILLSIGLLILIGWIFGWELVLRLRKDPLPARVRTYLNRLNSARLAVRSLALGAIARHRETELIEEKKLYDEIAEKADALLEKAKTDFCLNVGG